MPRSACSMARPGKIGSCTRPVPDRRLGPILVRRAAARSQKARFRFSLRRSMGVFHRLALCQRRRQRASVRGDSAPRAHDLRVFARQLGLGVAHSAAQGHERRSCGSGRGYEKTGAEKSREQSFLESCRSAGNLAKLLEGAHLPEGRRAADARLFLCAGKNRRPRVFRRRRRVGLRGSDLFGRRGDGALFGTARRLGNRFLAAPAGAGGSQMRGRYQLSRTMALPTHDETSEAPRAAKLYFDFISKSEKELMWSAASMTTRSGNLLRTSGESRVPPPLKRRNLEELRFE